MNFNLLKIEIPITFFPFGIRVFHTLKEKFEFTKFESF